MKRTYKYRLYPTEAQVVVLDRWLWLCRRLYNACLEQRIAAYQMQRKSLSRFTQDHELVDLKSGCPEFREIGAHVLQNVVYRVDVSFQRFFRKQAKYPRFQGRDRHDSFTFPDPQGWKVPNEPRVRLT